MSDTLEVIVLLPPAGVVALPDDVLPPEDGVAEDCDCWGCVFDATGVAASSNRRMVVISDAIHRRNNQVTKCERNPRGTDKKKETALSRFVCRKKRGSRRSPQYLLTLMRGYNCMC